MTLKKRLAGKLITKVESTYAVVGPSRSGAYRLDGAKPGFAEFNDSCKPLVAFVLGDDGQLKMVRARRRAKKKAKRRR